MRKGPAVDLRIGPHCFECIDLIVYVYFTENGDDYFRTTPITLPPLVRNEEIKESILKSFAEVSGMSSPAFGDKVSALFDKHTLDWWFHNRNRWVKVI